MYSRSIRRHHEERIKRRVKKYYRGVHQDNLRRSGAIAQTHALCSCWMCGNPRKYFGEITLQERRLRDEAQDEIIEFTNNIKS